MLAHSPSAWLPFLPLPPEQQQVAAASASHQQATHAPQNHQEDRSTAVRRALQGAVVPPRPLAPLHNLNRGGRGASGARGRLFRVLGRVIGLPWALVKVTLSSLWFVTSLSLSFIAILGNRLLPPGALRAFRGSPILMQPMSSPPLLIPPSSSLSTFSAL